ncbi:MAG: ribbon-helix-helix protein, CopG family [Streptosporangiaceae bacterium]
MIRTQISLTEGQMTRAQQEARRRGTSVAALLRDALDRLLDETGEAAVRDRAKLAVGGFRSGASDISSRHDEVLAEARRW